MPNDDTELSDLVEMLTAGVGHLRTPPPEELVRAILRLALDPKHSHAEHDFDEETGETRWRVTLVTETAVIQVAAAAQRTVDHFRNGQHSPTDWSQMHHDERGAKSYAHPPIVTVAVRRLANLRTLHVNSVGAADSYELTDRIKEVWTFVFSDGDGPIVFEIPPADERTPTTLDKLCAYLAAHL